MKMQHFPFVFNETLCATAIMVVDAVSAVGAVRSAGFLQTWPAAVVEPGYTF